MNCLLKLNFACRSVRTSSSSLLYRKASTTSHPSDLAAALAPLLIDHMRTGQEKPVVNFKNPKALYDHFVKIGVPLEIGDTHQTFDNQELLRACTEVLNHSVNTTSPLFNNQLYGTADPIGIAGI